MAEAVFDKVLTVVGLIIGILLILFGKAFMRRVFADQVTGAGQKSRRLFADFSETGRISILYKAGQIGSLVVGLLFVASSLADLFFEWGRKYVAWIGIFLILSLFAAGGSILLTSGLLRFLTRKLDRYSNHNLVQQHLRRHSSPFAQSVRLPSLEGDTDDPILKRLRRRTLYSVLAVFLIFFALFLIAQYLLIEATT